MIHILLCNLLVLYGSLCATTSSSLGDSTVQQEELSVQHIFEEFDEEHTKTRSGVIHGQHIPRLFESVVINKNKLSVAINRRLKARYLTSDFFAEYDDDINLERLDPSLAILPCLLNVITIVWVSGENYSIEAMDEDLFYSLKKLKKVLKRIFQKTSWKGNVIPDRLVKNKPIVPLKDPTKEIALFFSGGLDSTASSMHHHDKKQLLITLWGQYDLPLDRENIWRKRKKAVKEFAHTHGHSNAFVRSNYAQFLDWATLDHHVSKEITSWRVDTTEGMGLMGLAAPILLLKGYSLTAIASSQTWESLYACAANPFYDNNLLFASEFRAYHDLFDSERIDKLKLIAQTTHSLGRPYPFLKVCNGRAAENCCNSCSKCLPTIIGLLAINEDPRAYGFHISEHEALSRAKKYLSRKQDYEAIWAIQHVKELIKEKQQRGERVPNNLLWLFDVDLSKKIDNSYNEHCQLVNWYNFHDLCPENVTIPETIKSTVKRRLMKKSVIEKALKEEKRTKENIEKAAHREKEIKEAEIHRTIVLQELATAEQVLKEAEARKQAELAELVQTERALKEAEARKQHELQELARAAIKLKETEARRLAELEELAKAEQALREAEARKNRELQEIARAEQGLKEQLAREEKLRQEELKKIAQREQELKAVEERSMSKLQELAQEEALKKEGLQELARKEQELKELRTKEEARRKAELEDLAQQQLLAEETIQQESAPKKWWQRLKTTVDKLIT